MNTIPQIMLNGQPVEQLIVTRHPAFYVIAEELVGMSFNPLDLVK